MTVKRFEIKDSILKEGNVIIDNEKEYTFPVLDNTFNFMFCKALNELHEEKNRLLLQNGTMEEEIECLSEENQFLKQRLAEQNDVEWLRNNTVWEVMPSSHRTYISTIYHRRNDE